MKHVYMSISITFYPVSRIAPYRSLQPDCTFYQRVDDGEMTSEKLPLEKALRMQWELMKAGAERAYHSNMFNNAISQVDVDYWACH